MPNQLLKHEREQRGWSQARVAEQIGTDAGTISRWERGITSPTPYFRERLCVLYGKTAQELGLLEEKYPDREETDSVNSRQGISIEVPPTNLRILACLSILLGWITGLFVLLFYHSKKFVVFYCLQSICFFGIAQIVIMTFAIWLRPYTGRNPVIDFVGSATALIAFIVWVLSLVQAVQGKYYRFPVLGKYCEKIAESITST